MNETNPVICQADHVSKTYRLSAFQRVEAVKDVSLTIRKGETLGLVGSPAPARAPWGGSWPPWSSPPPAASASKSRTSPTGGS
ncbi:MAG: hypothetical protein LUH48_03055 [Clostridiales bacterium]|nr:hypothetical protein [Clostridiales bacterium]